MRRFEQFCCIDWSGSKAERTHALAVAVTSGETDVSLITPPQPWSRTDILAWLIDRARAADSLLIGLDLSPGFPYVDAGAYFPGWERSPGCAPDLWALVDALCVDDPHLSVPSFVAHGELSRYFRHQQVTGDRFGSGRGRLRVCEYGQAQMQLSPSSCFNLVGAAQVGKSSLSGMRVLHRLRGIIPVWPFDPVPARGPCIVEIYTSLAARQAGLRAGLSKIRDAVGLHSALAAFSAKLPAMPTTLNDHVSDAIVTAAWLRRNAHNPLNWAPAGMTPQIAATEGWTFGVVSR